MPLWTLIVELMTEREISSSIERVSEAGRPLTVRIHEACRLTGIGRSKLYELIRQRRIETIKVGAITLIPVVSLESFLGLREH